MPQHLVKRTFRGGVAITADGACALVLQKVVEINAAPGTTTWGHWFVSEDKKTRFCVYDAAPDLDAVREAADRNGVPVDEIEQISVLDPHFYR